MSKKGTVFIVIGCILILAAASLSVYNWQDSLRAEKSVSKASGVLSEHISDALIQQEDYTRYEDVEYIPDYVLDPDMDMPVKEIDGYNYIGMLNIPVLNLNLPVIESWSSSLLKLAPCRYVGSAYKSGFIIAAHNYDAHFAKLKELNAGDKIVFSDIEGNRFVYEVVTLENLKATDIEEMSAGDWDLTLFTCTPGGQYRVSVRCIRSKD